MNFFPQFSLSVISAISKSNDWIRLFVALWQLPNTKPRRKTAKDVKFVFIKFSWPHTQTAAKMSQTSVAGKLSFVITLGVIHTCFRWSTICCRHIWQIGDWSIQFASVIRFPNARRRWQTTGAIGWQQLQITLSASFPVSASSTKYKNK